MIPLALAVLLQAASSSSPPPDSGVSHIRINQVGYLPDGLKIAVVCSLEPREIESFEVRDENGNRIFGPAAAQSSGSFAACASTHRLDFSRLDREGTYRIVAGSAMSPPVRISNSAYAGAADTLLYYMRQQRSGWNPLYADSVHTKDGIIVDHPTREGDFINVSGGWADASDYLQYVTTSANAAFVMMMAYRDHPGAFTDEFAANGTPGKNGIPDVLDEARHGLEWLVRMFPGDGLMFNQLGDDRDHSFPDLPPTDSSDYGWGKGGPRPVYPCTGKPQGLLEHKNRSTGYASTAGKYAAAFGIGARLFAEQDSSFADTLARKAEEAFALGERHPGVCQTAPGGAPYFYEEDNWVDDMELGAAQLFALTSDRRFQAAGLGFAAKEPVTPWMGADTANHYQWFPWHNNAHYELWRLGDEAVRKQMAEYYRQGLERVVGRAGNGFRIGVPFIWCSSNLIASFATQAYLYRRMTADSTFLEYEAAALDWLFGTNPWGVSMVIGFPRDGRWARQPHAVAWRQLGWVLTGGLLDGPVYRSIFQNLRGIHLFEEDEYAPFNTGFIVYHDDYGDYSTNEPIMDGTANLTYLLAAMSAPRD